MEGRYRKRRQRVRNFCKTHDIDARGGGAYGRNVVVSEKHKLLWCVVPKVGSSQWKHVMGKLEGLDHIPRDILLRSGAFKFYSSYPPEKRQEMLKTYRKFMFVRHPFERLLSAYLEKFEGHQPAFVRHYGRLIIKAARPNASDYALKTGEGSTLAEFAKYVTMIPPGKFNIHWRPMHLVCHVCQIPYDYFGHFETFQEDADYILNQTAVDHLVRFPSFRGSKTGQQMLGRFADVPKDVVMALATEVYKHDLGMHDYAFPGPLSPLFAL